jgi:hypothetical protein
MRERCSYRLIARRKIIVTRLGSHKRPAVVRVSTKERAQELVDICRERDWQVIVGVEPDEPEDITDVLKLLEPERFTVRVEPTAGAQRSVSVRERRQV